MATKGQVRTEAKERRHPHSSATAENELPIVLLDRLIIIACLWTPVFLLPNIRVKESVAVDEAAIVAVDDERIRAYCRQYPAFGRFIGKFTDPFGARSTPGILLLQTSSRKTFRTLEAVSSFRDLVALSVIPLHRAKSIVHSTSFHIQYSDYFDFYPWNFNDKNSHLVCNTPALLGLHEVRAFKGQSSPVLSPLDLGHIDFDAPLLKQLLARWRSRYGASTPVWADVALFRSLNMAFAASKMPAGPDVTQFHVGSLVLQTAIQSDFALCFFVTFGPAPTQSIYRYAGA